MFAELKKHPDACAQQLVRSLRASPSLEARGLCAVLLRKVLTRDDASIWPGMSASVKEVVKTEMLNCIKEEQMRAVTKKVGGGGARSGLGGGARGWVGMVARLGDGWRLLARLRGWLVWLGCVGSGHGALM